MTGPAGLPLGYDHTETGAVEAATNYLTWMNSIRIKDKNTADAMAEATAADEKTRNAMIESFDLLRTGLEDVADAKPGRNRPELHLVDDNDLRARSGRRRAHRQCKQCGGGGGEDSVDGRRGVHFSEASRCSAWC